MRDRFLSPSQFVTVGLFYLALVCLLSFANSEQNSRPIRIEPVPPSWCWVFTINDTISEALR